MFTLDTIIDTVQRNKKQFVSLIFADKKIQSDLHTLIDAETATAKAGSVVAQATFAQVSDVMKKFVPSALSK